MTRSWPTPPTENTLHAIGDVQGASVTRLRIMLDDLDRDTVPQTEHRVTLGDCSRTGTPEDFAYFHDNFSSKITGNLWPVVGNHDMDQGLDGDQAAQALGMASKDYVVDMGFAVLIVLGPDEGYNDNPTGWKGECVYTETALTFLDQQLTAHASELCIVAAHPSLRYTVQSPRGPATSKATNTVPWFALDSSRLDDAAIRAVLADHPNAKAWLGGHTHSLISAPDIVKAVPVGGHTLASVNTSAILNPGSQLLPTTGIASPFLTVYDDRIEVRWRNHGAHQWVGSGAALERVSTVMF